MSMPADRGDDVQFDYTTIGHVTVDVLPDGSRQAGGTAFYSALQAARLGARALVLTRGVERELHELLEPYRHELHVEIDPAAQTTTLLTSGTGETRAQRVLAWAGPMAEDLRVETSILHLAPVARESPLRWLGHATFLGLTPQGFVRRWSGPDTTVTLAEPDAQRTHDAIALARLARACDALVINERERDSCAGLVEAARAAGTLVAVTAGARPSTIMRRGEVASLDVPALDDPVDDLGAGDVFAAALFVALREGASDERAAALATAAAAVRMQGWGPQAIGARAAIERRLAAAAAAAVAGD